jgi:hypothetical protein
VEIVNLYLFFVCCEKCKTEKFYPLMFYFFNLKDHSYSISVAEHLGPARSTSVRWSIFKNHYFRV